MNAHLIALLLCILGLLIVALVAYYAVRYCPEEKPLCSHCGNEIAHRQPFTIAMEPVCFSCWYEHITPN